jgi:hypothetical protein
VLSTQFWAEWWPDATGIVILELCVDYQQTVEKVVFRRLFNNIQMQGMRNPEE